MPKKDAKQLIATILDKKLPIEHRAHLMAQVCIGGDNANHEVVARILDAAAANSGATIYEQRIAEIEERIKQLAEGPLRVVVFRCMLDGGPLFSRASVLLEDGSAAFVTLPDPEMAATLRSGDLLLVDAQGRAVLSRHPTPPQTGELVRFERRLEGERIEVATRGDERLVVWAAAHLADGLDSGEIEPGRMLIACLRRRMAFDAVPPEDGLAHYIYLAREAVPEVTLADIGAAPHYVLELIELVRQEMTRPEVRRRYRLYRSKMTLLAGPTGTGKSYSIRGLWRELYVTMSEVTGVPVADLPPRVIRLRMPQVLSKWLGESDKNLDKLFDEVEQLAGDPFVAPDGRRYVLPVLCILEEIDGLARARGHEPIHDRILTTALERLDTTRPELRDRLVLFVATTNVPQQVDAAFVRRAGGTIEHFGRLGRGAFMDVLDKQLRGRPVALANGAGAERARRQLIAGVAAWLFPPERADAVQVELTYAGSTTAVPKFRRDFLTPSIVDRSLQVASSVAALAEGRGETDAPGLTCELLIDALDRQVRGIVDALHASNVGDYLDLPEGARVASLRRPPQSVPQPVRLEPIR